MSAGTLMQCLAGLWWDQQRRTCVLPSEVACNPYNIINSQGQGVNIDNPPAPVGLPVFGTTPLVALPQPSIPVSSGKSRTHLSSHSRDSRSFPGLGGVACRGAPSCIEIGLNILQQMKAIPGRAGWLYVANGCLNTLVHASLHPH